DNDVVMMGAYLAAIENPANLEDAFALKKQLDTLATLVENPDNIQEIEFDQRGVLGELQADYSNFMQTIGWLRPCVLEQDFDGKSRCSNGAAMLELPFADAVLFHLFIKVPVT
ncbi:MAG: hypothetical protein ACRENG_29360, partial [bacterium]